MFTFIHWSITKLSQNNLVIVANTYCLLKSLVQYQMITDEANELANAYCMLLFTVFNLIMPQ